MSHAIKLMLMWSLSPVGTLLNAGLLAVAMLLWGGDPGNGVFWLVILIFLAVSAWFDVRAYITQRRLGLTSYEVAEAVFERMWRPRPRRES